MKVDQLKLEPNSWTSLLGRLSMGFCRVYLCEYIALLLLLILAYTLPDFYGHHQELIMIDGDLKNPELNHPRIASTVSSIDVNLSTFAAFFLLLCYRAQDSDARWFGINAMVREMAWSWSLAEVITSCAKLYVGRPRPNFFELCKWDGTECTTNEKRAYSSFPSGHSSSAMARFGLICIHFVENVLLQLRGYKFPMERLDVSPYGWLYNLFIPITRAIGPPAILVALVPGLFAFFVACSRIHDYWHFVSDVLAGGFIGISSALLSFSMFRKKVRLHAYSPIVADVEVPVVEEAWN